MSASLCKGDGGQAQALGAARHGWVVDRLNVDPVALQQLVAGGLAEAGVADHDRDDVARRRHHRQPGLGQAALQCGGALLIVLAFDPALFQVAYRGERPGGERGRQ
jgi:hypothetical protein